jgi:hypothetical protein
VAERLRLLLSAVIAALLVASAAVGHEVLPQVGGAGSPRPQKPERLALLPPIDFNLEEDTFANEPVSDLDPDAATPACGRSPATWQKVATSALRPTSG